MAVNLICLLSASWQEEFPALCVDKAQLNRWNRFTYTFMESLIITLLMYVVKLLTKKRRPKEKNGYLLNQWLIAMIEANSSITCKRSRMMIWINTTLGIVRNTYPMEGGAKYWFTAGTLLIQIRTHISLLFVYNIQNSLLT